MKAAKGDWTGEIHVIFAAMSKLSLEIMLASVVRRSISLLCKDTLEKVVHPKVFLSEPFC